MNSYKQPFYIVVYYVPLMVVLGVFGFFTSLLRNYQIIFYIILGLIFVGSLYYFVLYMFRVIRLDEALVISYFKKDKIHIEYLNIIKVDESRYNCAIHYRWKEKIKIINVSKMLVGYKTFMNELESNVDCDIVRW
jgi:hypothetical protein